MPQCGLQLRYTFRATLEIKMFVRRAVDLWGVLVLPIDQVWGEATCDFCVGGVHYRLNKLI